MSYDVIDRLVRPANPVPDPTMLKPVDFSVLPVHRKEDMQREQVEVDHVEETGVRRRGWIGIAAALVVLLGGLVLFQMANQDDVASEPTPLEIATAYLAAYSQFDMEAVESMLADDAEVLPWEAYEPRDWKSDLRFLEAAGFQILVGECTEATATDGAFAFNCAYGAHGLGSDQIGLGPFTGHVFRLVIEDGLVTRSDMGFTFTEFSEQMWWPFQAWVNENHEDEFAVLYVDPGLSRQTDDAIVLWEQRVADYVEYVNNPTTTTTPVEGSVPAELVGIWRGRSSTGEMVNFRLEGTTYSVSVADINFIGDVVVSDDTIVIPATPDTGLASSPGSQCSIDRQFTWSIEGDELILTEVVEDTCFTMEYLAGTVFKKFWSP
ncbi:MAG TPA: hypothetical protein VFS66_05845 [Acidimicrobiia bacterium]|nr:hypothetical protein [Acidimicrobiia bacterium]